MDFKIGDMVSYYPSGLVGTHFEAKVAGFTKRRVRIEIEFPEGVLTRAVVAWRLARQGLLLI